MTTDTPMRAMTQRLVRESLAELRREAALRDWDGMDEYMSTRLPKLCRDAAQAQLWGRVRLALRRQEWTP